MIGLSGVIVLSNSMWLIALGDDSAIWFTACVIANHICTLIKHVYYTSTDYVPAPSFSGPTSMYPMASHFEVLKRPGLGLWGAIQAVCAALAVKAFLEHC